ncbi:MAG TPA: hypothetical protein VIL17_00340, partial [Coriobacteriia bacterium]
MSAFMAARSGIGTSGSRHAIAGALSRTFGAALAVVLAVSLSAPGIPVASAQPALGHNVQANPDNEGLGASGWAADTGITFTVFDGETPVGTGSLTTNADGNGWTTCSGDIQPGMTVRATDGVSTSEIWVDSTITVTGVDPESDTLSGTAPEGTRVQAFKNGFMGPGPEGTADSEGNWSISLTDVGGLSLGDNGSVFAYDAEGDAVVLNWRVANPALNVNISSNGFGLNDWPANSSVTVTVTGGGLAEPRVQSFDTDENGNGGGGIEGLDLIGGMTVDAEGPGGTPHKTLVIPPELAITSVDWENDIVSGTAPAGSEVTVWMQRDPSGSSTNTVATGGTWSVDYAGVVDIQLGDSGQAMVRDDDGDSASVAFAAARPTLTVDPWSDNVWIDGWPADTDVTVSVDFPTGWSAVIHTDGMGSGQRWTRDYGDNYDITTGVATASDGSTTKNLLIAGGFSVTHTDAAANTVAGTALEGTTVTVEFRGPGWQELTTTVAGADSRWLATLDHDFGANDQGRVWVEDLEGDRTQLDWRAGTPFIQATSEGALWASDWSPMTVVTFRMSTDPDPLTGTVIATIQTDERGNGYADPGGPMTFADGVYVHASDAWDTKTLQMAGGFAVTEVKPLTNTVSGTAPFGEVVTVTGDSNEWPQPTATDTANGADRWSATFDGFDIVPGSTGMAMLADGDGDSQITWWNAPNPVLWVDLAAGGGIFLEDWTPGTTVDVKVYDHEGGEVLLSRTATIDSSRWWSSEDLGEFTLAPGQYVVAAGADGTTKSLTIENLAITEIDPDAGTVSGTSGADGTLDAWIDGRDGTQVPIVDGVWSVDFGYAGGFGRGDSGMVSLPDPDGDSTRVGWRIPNPRVVADVKNNTIGIEDWPAGTTVHVAVFEDVSGAPGETPITGLDWDLTVDEWGNSETWLDAGVLTAGRWVRASQVDGADKLLQIENLTASADPDTDIVSGAADPDTAVSIWIDAYGDSNRDLLANDEGWMYNYSGQYDIVLGSSGMAEIRDDDGDVTRAGWQIPRYALVAEPQSGMLSLEEWPAGATVHLALYPDGETRPDIPLWESDLLIDESGYGSSGVGGNLEPGVYVVASLGAVEKELHVATLTATADKDTDTVSGTADPGSPVHVFAWDSNEEYNPIVDGAGTWSQHFDGGINPGSGGAAEIPDGDGDSTRASWYVLNPVVHANLFWDNIAVMDFPMGSTVTVVVDTDGDPGTGEPLFEGTAIVTDYTGWGWGGAEFNDLGGLDLVPGLFVTASDGETTKTLQLAPIAVTSVDADTDTLTGTAPPRAWVDASVSGREMPTGTRVQADISGNWSMFIGGGGGILPNDQGSASVTDDDGDWTDTAWSLAPPSIAVDSRNDSVEGWGFVPGATVTFTFDGTLHWEGVADSHGNLRSEGSVRFDIVAGQVCTATDGSATKTLDVADVRVTAVNIGADTISGTASADTTVIVIASTSEDPGMNARETKSDGSGAWTADFTTTNPETGESPFDITALSSGRAFDRDADGDNNVDFWKADSAPPVTGHNAVASYLGTATITLHPDDGSGSGVAYTKWSVDGGGWTTGTVVATSTAGDHTLQFYSVDNAGNEEDPQTVGFRLSTRFEQTDSKLAFAGAWSTATGASYSGGSLKVGSGTGVEFSAAFSGTS